MRDSDTQKSYNETGPVYGPSSVGASCGSGSSPAPSSISGRQLLNRTILDLRLAADSLQALSDQLPAVLNYQADQGLLALVQVVRKDVL